MGMKFFTKPEPMGKPHLRPFAPLVITAGEKWLCYGRFWRAVGSTPQEAYERWCEAISELVRPNSASLHKGRAK